jgi:hypothetical protein
VDATFGSTIIGDPSIQPVPRKVSKNVSVIECVCVFLRSCLARHPRNDVCFVDDVEKKADDVSESMKTCPEEPAGEREDGKHNLYNY